MKTRSCPKSSPAATAATTLASRNLVLTDTWGSSLAWFLASLRSSFTRPIFVATAEPEDMNDLVGDLELFGGSEEVYAFPPWDVLPTETDHPELEVAHDRLATLRALLAANRTDGAATPRLAPLVAAPVTALMQPTLPPEALARGHISVAPGIEMSPEGLLARLVDAGLEATSQVDGAGQFSRRGGIIDVYPLFADEPVRIEFFGDEVDTVRHFDPATQRSGKPLAATITLVDVSRDSFREAYQQPCPAGILDYLPKDTLVILHRPTRLRQIAELYAGGFFEDDSPLLSWQSIFAGVGFDSDANNPARDQQNAPVAKRKKSSTTFAPTSPQRSLADFRRLLVPAFTEGMTGADSLALPDDYEFLSLNTQGLERIAGGLDTALAEVGVLLEKNTCVTIYCNNPAERSRLHEILLEKGGGLAGRVELRIGHLAKGFIATDHPWQHDGKPYAHWAAIGDHEIFARHQLRRQPRRKFAGAPIADFTDLREGDYVVHVVNGIARYEGVVTLESNGTEQDYLQLRFAEDARLYVPLSHVDLVQRFIGSHEARPALSKLGGTSWAKRKRAAEKAAKDVAADLLRVQAVRQALPGTALDPDDALQIEFDSAFPYTETPDQLAAINDVKADQESTVPMDRLICGDVGFGKTEVAIRAAFKVVNAGKQVGILVPTTILAEQHFRTFTERMADYPVRIGCLSRFRSNAEQRQLAADLAAGKIDIMIGTHRLLSQDVKFKDLGLAVIDEEQRFGVDHKEKLKALRAMVDVMTMTATPIPRTLHMSLLGLRDISTLTTAPTDRHSIRTLVMPYSDEIIRRAILRELSRGGQCFFLHNRVQNIDSVAGELAKLIPEARFGIAHGQLGEGALLDVMSRFLAGNIDVLVTTTIIESGVDIPTVNTLIVNNANHFGLSELHQLRGRVGRYRYQAYAYFLIPKKRAITPIAEKRLQALEEYSELGAGFRIAMRDLEIRGAGNILGLEQSGQIQNVGFELYCQLLEKAVASYRGEEVVDAEPVELDLGTRAFIPTEYIPDDMQRVDFYRKLSAAATPDELKNLKAYLRDRYGNLPAAAKSLFRDQELRHRATRAGINFIGRIDTALAIGFNEGRGQEGLTKLRSIGRKVTVLEKARWRVELGSDEPTLDEILATLEQILKHLLAPTPKRKKKKLNRATSQEAFGGTAPTAPPKPTHIDRIEVGKKPSRNYRKDAPGAITPAAAQALINPHKDRKTLDRVEVGGTAPHRTPRQAALDEVSAKFNFGIENSGDKEAKNTQIAGTKIIGIEPQARLGIIGVIVDEHDFDSRRFGTVTLVIGNSSGGDKGNDSAEPARYFLRFTGTGRAPRGQVSLTLRAASEEEVTAIANAHLASGESRILTGLVD